MGQPESQIVFILSTYPNYVSVQKVGKLAVGKRLAGCVLTIPVGSVYRWEEKIVNTKEVLAVFKTTKEKAKKLAKLVAVQHPYEVPFVAMMPLKGVNKKYQQWLVRELRAG